MLDETLTGIEIDKCSEGYTIKIPEILKNSIDTFEPPEKAKLKRAILLLMAEHVHRKAFNPEIYLSSRET